MLLDEDGKATLHVLRGETGVLGDAQAGQPAMEEQAGEYMLW